jgi:hypothetical protein
MKLIAIEVMTLVMLGTSVALGDRGPPALAAVAMAISLLLAVVGTVVSARRGDHLDRP